MNYVRLQISVNRELPCRDLDVDPIVNSIQAFSD